MVVGKPFFGILGPQTTKRWWLNLFGILGPQTKILGRWVNAIFEIRLFDSLCRVHVHHMYYTVLYFYLLPLVFELTNWEGGVVRVLGTTTGDVLFDLPPHATREHHLSVYINIYFSICLFVTHVCIHCS